MKICLISLIVVANCVLAGTLKDLRDNKEYKTVEIAGAEWMAENLNYNAPKGSGCYGDRPAMCQIYGRLYTYPTAVTACPTGWSLPTHDDLNALTEYVEREGKKVKKVQEKSGSLGTTQVETIIPAGTLLKAKSQPADVNEWKDGKEYYTNELGGRNAFGFTAMMGGAYVPYSESQAVYEKMGNEGKWWITNYDEYCNERNAYFSLSSNSSDIVSGADNFGNRYAFSIRCIKDKSSRGVIEFGKKKWVIGSVESSVEFSKAMKYCPKGSHLPSVDEWQNFLIGMGAMNMQNRFKNSSRQFNVPEARDDKQCLRNHNSNFSWGNKYWVDPKDSKFENSPCVATYQTDGLIDACSDANNKQNIAIPVCVSDN